MNWFKKAEMTKRKDGKFPQGVVDHIWQAFGVNINTGEVKTYPKRERKDTGECAHSMDMNCDGGDDGW